MQSVIPRIDIQPVAEFKPEPLDDTLAKFRDMSILFCPDTNETRSVMRRLLWWSCDQVVQCNRETTTPDTMYAEGWAPRVHGFATEADMLEHNRHLALAYSGNASIGPAVSRGYLGSMDQVVGVDFTSLASGDVAYTVRMQQKIAPRLSRWKTPADGGADANETSTILSSDLLRTGFILLEHALNEAIASWQNDRHAIKPETLRQSDVEVARFPRQEWHAKYGSDSSGTGFGLGLLVRLYLPLAYMTSVSLLIVGIVDEKEKKLKEGMRMMGLTDAAYWSSWVLSHSAMAVVVVILSSLLVAKFGLFPLTETGWVAALLFSYNVALVPPCMIISLIFSKVKSASNATSVFSIPVLLSIPLGLVGGFHNTKVFLSLLSPIGFSLALGRVVELEGQGKGLNWDTAGLNDGEEAVTIPFWWSFGMMNLGTIVFSALTWYLGQILPGEYGIKRPWNFPCSRLRGLGVATDGVTETMLTSEQVGDSNDSMEQGGLGVAVEESPPTELDVQVRMRGLRKVYEKSSESKSGEDVVAVDHLDLDLYSSQIFCLLGHNGAGKSSVIGMLTGLFEATAGTIEVLGHDLGTETDQARQTMGVCPQHDVLFEKLTCIEHLRIFAGIKGCVDESDSAFEELLRLVDLGDKRNGIASELSGGQKRKLSLAIALVGDPKFLILDEPTSGMDPVTRRAIWQTLEQRKPDRVMLLTTHYMDEADVLGDRVGVMHTGSLKCIGSPLFLKNRYGVGYDLALTRDGVSCDDVAVLTCVQRHVPGATVKDTQGGSDMHIQLPFGNESRFPDLFTELDASLEQLGVKGYGVAVTTLEQVFLRITEDFDETQGNELNATGASVAADFCAAAPQMLQRDRMQQLKAMMWKHRLLFQREWKSYLFYSLFMCAYMAYALVTSSAMGDTPPVGVSLSVMSAGTADPIEKFLPYDTPVLPGGSAAPIPSCSKDGQDIQQCLSSAVKLRREHPLDGLDGRLFGEPTDGEAAAAAVDFSSATCGQPTEGNPGFRYTLLYNESIPAALPAFLALMDSCRLYGEPDAISVTSKPFPDPHPRVVLNPMTSIIAGIAFVTSSVSFIATIVKERAVSKTTQQLMVMGLDSKIFWLSQILGDGCYLLLGFLVPTWILVLVWGIPYLTGVCFGPFVLLTISALFSSLTASYLISVLFKAPETAAGVVMLLWILAVELSYVIGISLPLALPAEMFGTAQAVNAVCLFLVPPYTIIAGMNALFNIVSMGPPLESAADVFVWSFVSMDERPFIGPAAALVIPTVAWGGIFAAFVFCQRIPVVGEGMAAPLPKVAVLSEDGQVVGAEDEAEDEAVFAERRMIEGPGTGRDDTVLAVHLRKEYRKEKKDKKKKGKNEKKDKLKKDSKEKRARTIAVEDLSVGLTTGECFGLLGPNGAGKSSSLDMLCGIEPPTRGAVTVGGKSTIDRLPEVHKRTALCPQLGGLWDTITAREHIEIYAGIKCLPQQEVKSRATAVLTALDMLKHADKQVKELSGGNKRKLSVGIALLADSSVIFLDEPSCGVDPATRRSMWSAIGRSTAGRVIVLTTHSMEEADVLSSRIGIMCNGRLHALGSPQALKNQHGAQYTLEIKTENQTCGSAVASYVADNHADAELIERHGDSLSFSIPRESTRLAELFRDMEGEGRARGVTEYSISQTTLEQVFLRIAKKQRDDEEDEVEGAAETRASVETAGVSSPRLLQ